MSIGILALAVIFLASGAKNIKDFKISRSPDTAARRKLLFGVLMIVLGVLVSIYYAISIFAN